MGRTLTPLAGAYAICRLPATSSIPPAPPVGGAPGLWSVTRTAAELSVVCRAHETPAGATVDAPWTTLRLEGPFDLQGETGIIASVAAAIAEARISVFALATYDTDYVLVPAGRAAQACRALAAAGHVIRRPAVRTRATTVADTPAVGRLVREGLLGYRAFAGAEFDADDPIADPDVLTERLQRPGTRSFVALDPDGAVVGVVGMIATDDPGVGHVWQVFVDPAHQGTGVADDLLDALERAARADGRTRLQLYAADAATPARTFYARRGWTPAPDGRPGPPGLPVTRLVLEVRPAEPG